MKNRRAAIVAFTAAVFVSPHPAQGQESAPSATAAADVVAAILQGSDDEGAWEELSTALGGVPLPASRPSDVVSETPLLAPPLGDAAQAAGPVAETVGWAEQSVATLGRWWATISSVDWSLELVAILGIVALLLVAALSLALGAVRRRSAAGGVARSGRSATRRAESTSRPRVSRRARGRAKALRSSRDAERLAARLQTRRTA